MRIEDERDFLLDSLRDLEAEHDAGEIADEDFARLRDEYTVRAAHALRAAGAPDALRAAGAPDALRAARAAGEPEPPRRRSPRALALITLGVVAVAATAGVLVAQSSGERVAGRPITGVAPPTVPPDDLTRARQLFSERRYLDALKLYDKVLAGQPNNVEALAYRGWLLFQASPEQFTDRALDSLDRAVLVEPSFPDAHFFRGWVLHHGKGDPAAAVPEYRAFIATDPPAEFRQRVEQELNLALCAMGQAPDGITCPAAPSP
jgi:tetratricopeptide (TPR) repeat protein